MSVVQLRRLDPARNMARFYTLAVQQDLFGGWWLVREHGRIGSPGRVLSTPFPDMDAAAIALVKLWRVKLRRGYKDINQMIQGNSQRSARVFINDG